MKESILIFMLVSLIITGYFSRNNMKKIQYNISSKELVLNQIKEQVKKECLK